jgi:hypothetical protein
MGPLLYILRKTYKNAILQVFKKPASLIGYLVFIGFMIMNSIILIFDTAPTTIKQQNFDVYSILVTGFIILSIFPSLYKSTGNVNLPLRTADTHFLFTGPVKPSSILIYAQIIQSLMSVLVALLMIIQGPLLIRYLGLDMSGVWLFVFAWAFMLISFSQICMCLFTLQVKIPQLKLVFRITFFVSLLSVLMLFLYGILNGDNMLKGAVNVINHPLYDYLPFIGWYKVVFEAGIYGIDTHTIVIFSMALLVTIISSVTMIKLTDTSFYENAIGNSAKMERFREALNKGENSFKAFYQRKNKGAKKFDFQFIGSGGKVIRQKYYLELRKSSLILLYISSIVTIIGSLSVAYLMSTIDGVDGSVILSGALIVNIAMLFFNSMTSNTGELSNPYLYLIPETSLKKLYAITYWRGIKILADTIIPLILISLYFRAFQPEILIIPVITLAFGLQVYFTDIILATYIGRIGTLILRIYIKMFISMISITPMIIMIAVMLALGRPLTLTLVFTACLLVVMSGGLFILASRMFNKPEVYN